ncbi:T9SS type A sorting domain-containing protein [Chryseobacterium caseinilyticum]|uniref:T9SS type A sorting domain-containing protein n=1 Tax=Chryseobacterium caseinilyticum TaxID=2771428 RepID=A0ABR8Z8K8_9FLAO|nr:T9SS type A sorting domain-containing protein [Chryseobacterium caseinilyticum]MBD8081208.1 T9SS type A sorting domain-containing protein [Chryseobacterium caseinilyticum]
MKKIVITSLALVASLANAQLSLVADSNFGNNSIVDLGSGLSGFLSYHFSDNKIIVQNYDMTNNSTDSRITMLSNNGSVDQTFGTAGSFSCPLSYGTSSSGDFIHNFGDVSLMMFSGKKFHYNGTLDQTYGTAGQSQILPNEIYRKVLPNGKLLIRTANSIYQFNASGQLDSAFGTNGTMACNSTLSNFSSTIFSNHEKYVPLHTGNSIIEYESNSSSLRKMNYTTGNYDINFGINGNAQYKTGPSATIMKFHMMPDNSLVNYLFEDNDPSVKFLTKTLSTGMLDTSFGSSGRIGLPAVIDGVNLLYGQDFTVVNNHVVIPVLDDGFPRKLYLMSAGSNNVSTINSQNLLDTGITTSMYNPDDKIFISAKGNYLYLMINPTIIKRYVISNSILATNEAESETDIRFVNPFQDELNLFTNEKIKSVEIYDQNGRLILKNSSAKTVNTSNLTEAIYIIKITTESGKVVTKKGMKL